MTPVITPRRPSFSSCDYMAQKLLADIPASESAAVRRGSGKSDDSKSLVFLLSSTAVVLNKMAKSAEPRSDLRRTLYSAKSALLSVILSVQPEAVSVSFQGVEHEFDLLLTVSDSLTGKKHSLHAATHFLSASARAALWDLTAPD